MQVVSVDDVSFGGEASPFALIAGPCVIESLDLCREVASRVSSICAKLGIGYIFKASFDKANRTSGSSFRGSGMDSGLEILAQIKSEFNVPVLTDVHESWQTGPAAEVVDILQIPAFLCRQTDLLIAAAHTGRVVNIKKGQFMAPWDMANVAAKVTTEGNNRILLTERGASFGYNTLVVDMTSLATMRAEGFPVIFDGTHAVQKPGGLGTSSGGMRQWIPHLVRAAAGVGIDGLFLETHPEPEKALSDAATMLALDDLEPLLRTALAIDAIVKGRKVV